jgi:hypothetical protein
MENPTWKTCHRRECGDLYRQQKKENIQIADIDIKDIRNKISSNQMKIRYLQKDLDRLYYLRTLYENRK